MLWIIYPKISSFFIVPTLPYILFFFLIWYICLLFVYETTKTYEKTKLPIINMNTPKLWSEHSKTRTTKALKNTHHKNTPKHFAFDIQPQLIRELTSIVSDHSPIQSNYKSIMSRTTKPLSRTLRGQLPISPSFKDHSPPFSI